MPNCLKGNPDPKLHSSHVAIDRPRVDLGSFNVIIERRKQVSFGSSLRIFRAPKGDQFLCVFRAPACFQGCKRASGFDENVDPFSRLC